MDPQLAIGIAGAGQQGVVVEDAAALQDPEAVDPATGRLATGHDLADRRLDLLAAALDELVGRGESHRQVGVAQVGDQFRQR